MNMDDTLSRKGLTERPWVVFEVVSVGVFVASLDLFIVNIAFPDLERDFRGTHIAALSWIRNTASALLQASPCLQSNFSPLPAALLEWPQSSRNRAAELRDGQ